MDNFKIYRKVDGEYQWWTDLDQSYGTTPQDVRRNLMVDYPKDEFIVVKRSWIQELT